MVVLVVTALAILSVDAVSKAAAVAGGGALGNAMDRWGGHSSGGVVDWIRLPFYPAYFNVADVGVRGGGLLLVGLSLAAAVQEWVAGSGGFPRRDRLLHRAPPAPDLL